MDEFIDDQNCFVCGANNPHGLRLKFRQDNGCTCTEVTFPAFLQGWQDKVHGGATAMVLDEVMVQSAMAKGIHCVTAELKTTFKKPVRTESPYLAVGKVLETRGRITTTEAVLRDASGQVYVKAEAKLYRVD